MEISNVKINSIKPAQTEKLENAKDQTCTCENSHNQINDLKAMPSTAQASQVKHVTHIGPGSPILENAAPIISKDGKATLYVAQRDGEITDIWSGRTVPYSKGDIVMYYGRSDLDYVDKGVAEKAKARGENFVRDFNRSVDPQLMRETYVNAETGEYLAETGELEAGKNPIKAIKRAKGGCLIAPAGTKVHTLETIKKNLPPVEVKPGQVVALDHKGNPYVQDVTVMLKKNVPTSPEAEAMFEDMADFIEYRDWAKERYSAEVAEERIADSWEGLVQKYFQ